MRLQSFRFDLEASGDSEDRKVTGSGLCDCLTWVSDLSGTGLLSGLFWELALSDV